MSWGKCWISSTSLVSCVITLIIRTNGGCTTQEEEEIAKKSYPLKADVYSYGITCAEILTGKIPFPHTEYKRTKLLQVIRQGERPPLPLDCPTPLANLITRCWDTDPCNRPGFLQVCNELLDFKRANMMIWVLTTNRAVFQPQNQTRGSQSAWVFLYNEKLKWQEGYLCMLVTAWMRISLSLLLAIFKV
jgi:serine/threonine protein kinase